MAVTLLDEPAYDPTPEGCNKLLEQARTHLTSTTGWTRHRNQAGATVESVATTQGGTPLIRVRFTANVSPDRAWKQLSDTENMPDWDPSDKGLEDVHVDNNVTATVATRLAHQLTLFMPCATMREALIQQVRSGGDERMLTAVSVTDPRSARPAKGRLRYWQRMWCISVRPGEGDAAATTSTVTILLQQKHVGCCCLVSLVTSGALSPGAKVMANGLRGVAEAAPTESDATVDIGGEGGGAAGGGDGAATVAGS